MPAPPVGVLSVRSINAAPSISAADAGNNAGAANDAANAPGSASPFPWGWLRKSVPAAFLARGEGSVSASWAVPKGAPC